MHILELAVRSPLIVRVGGAEYKVEFPVLAVVQLEDKLGRPMKSAADWLQIKTRELPDLLSVGLSRNHAEEAVTVAASICDTLETEAIDEVINGLCYSVFPRAMAKIEEAVKRIQERAEKGTESPNVPSVAAS